MTIDDTTDTDKEYHVQQNGQKKLDAENAKLIAEGKQPKETIFDTRQRLRLRPRVRNRLHCALSNA